MAQTVKLKANVNMIVYATYKSYDIAKNEHTYNIRVRLSHSTGGSYRYYGSGNGYRIRLQISGLGYSYNSGYMDFDWTIGTVDIFDRDVTIAANDDGSPKGSKVTAAIDGQSGQVLANTTGHSAGLTINNIPTIPRASTFVLSGKTDTSEERIVTVTKAVSAYRNDLWYRVGNGAWVQFGYKSENKTIFEFTIPHEAIPSAEKATITIALQTYSGNNNTKIGAEVRDTYEAEVPKSIKPEVPLLELSEYISAVSDLNLGANRYVQNKSRIAAEIKNIVPGLGATIKSYQIVIGNQSVSSAQGLTNVITQRGNITVSATVVDSRNRSATYESAITVLEYQAPQINAVDINRSTAFGVVNSDGVYASLKFKTIASSLKDLGGNEKNFLKYKVETAKAGSLWELKVSEQTILLNSDIHNILETFDVSLGYNVKITLIDVFDEIGITGEILYIPIGGTNFFAGSRGNASAFGRFPIYGTQYHLEIHDKGMINSGPYIDKNGNELIGEEDTGWLSATLANGYTAYSTNTHPKYRIKNGVLEVKGAVKPPAGNLAGTSSGEVFATIPHEPNGYGVVQTQQGSGSHEWLLRWESGGGLRIERYKANNAGDGSYITPGTTVWLPFQFMAFID